EVVLFDRRHPGPFNHLIAVQQSRVIDHVLFDRRAGALLQYGPRQFADSSLGVESESHISEQTPRRFMYIIQTLIIEYKFQLRLSPGQRRRIEFFAQSGFADQAARDEQWGDMSPWRGAVFRDLTEQSGGFVEVTRVKVGGGDLVGAIGADERRAIDGKRRRNILSA